MATLTLRVLTRSGDTTKGSPLTNAELDQNFINLDADIESLNTLKAPINNPTFTGSVVIPAGTIDNTAIGATTRGAGYFTILAANGNFTATSGTASTSTTTGAAVVTGGLGVSGAANIGGTATLAAITTGTNTTAVGTVAATNTQFMGNSTNPAAVTFHRSGAYAINMGMDTDNIFRLGGYSDGLNVYRWTSDTAGNFVARGNISAYSDIRLKTDLTKIVGALDKVDQLTGYTYTRVDSGERQTGLIAQDVEAVLPEAVMQGDMLSVNYGNLVGLLVEAIKELRQEVRILKGE